MVEPVDAAVVADQTQKVDGKTRRHVVADDSSRQDRLLVGLGLVAEQTLARHAHDAHYVVFAASLDVETGEVAYPKGFVSRVFTTERLIVSDAYVTFVQGKYYDGDAIADLDPKYENMRGQAVLTYTAEPNAAAAEWYTNFYQSAGYADCDNEFAKLILVEYGYDMGNPDNVSKNLTDGIRILPWGRDYTFLAIAKDAEGYFGNCTAQVVNLSKEGASPAQEFVDANK